MYNVSAEFKQAIKQPSRIISAKVEINGNVYDEEYIIGMNYEDTSNPSSQFEIGTTSATMVELSLMNVNEVFETSVIHPYFGLVVNGSIEYVPLGKFYADKVERKKNVVNLTLYDGMIKLEQAYFSDLTYPATITDVINEVATKTGITFEGVLPNYQINKKPEGYTYREIVGLIASMCGGFAKFNRDGKLTIKSYVNVSESITSDNYIDYNKKKDTVYRIDKITVQTDETILTAGSLSAGGSEVSFENPWMTREILNDIFAKLNGFEYLPTYVKIQGNPALECGDIVTLTTIDSEIIQIPIMKHKLSYQGGLIGEIESEGESENQNQFNSSGSMSKKVERVVYEQALINEALINKASIEDLAAVNARIDNLTVHTAMIEDLAVTNAKIADAAITSAKIQDAAITTAKIGQAQIQTAHIQTGAITTALIADGAIQNAQIADGSITDAKIVNLDAAKIVSGTIDTGQVTISGPDGHFRILENRLQIFDNQEVPVERITLGDVNGDGTVYGLRVRGQDGVTVLYDENGVYNEGITNGAITNPKISDGAVTNRVIAAETITGDKLVAETITGREIKAKTITANHLVANTITADSGVIAEAAITDAHIAYLDASKITTGTLDAARIRVGPATFFEDGYDPTKIDVGVRNLLKNSNSPIISNSKYGIGSYEFTVDLIAGETYTFTFNGRIDSTFKNDGGVLRGYIYEYTWSHGSFSIALDSTTDTTVKLTFTPSWTGRYVCGFYRYPSDVATSSSGYAYVNWATVVKANKGTADWIPAHEDNPALLWQYGNTTYIDGGKIYANSITANQIAAGAITADKLATRSITADKLNVTSLSAISANLGTITAGTISGVTIQGSTIKGTGTTRVEMLNDTVRFYRSGSYMGQVTTADMYGSGEKMLHLIGTNSVYSVAGVAPESTTLGAGSSVYVGKNYSYIYARNKTSSSNTEAQLLVSTSEINIDYASAGGWANLRMGTDGTGGFVQSPTIYNRTYSSGANVYVTMYGTLGRNTSATKYKLAIEEVTDQSYFGKLLQLQPKSWYDKAATEAYADYLDRHNGSDEGIDESHEDIPYLQRYIGLIAEDLEALGLTNFLEYGPPDEFGNREIEGIAYDRLWVLTIPLIRELKQKIEQLEGKVA